MARGVGNRRLKAARLARGYGSQQALADALEVGVRQVRRWESESPPWPTEHHQQKLRALLGLDLEQLGFVPPWQDESAHLPVRGSAPTQSGRPSFPVRIPTRAGMRPAMRDAVAQHYDSITEAHRKLYWSIDPRPLHDAVCEHVKLGESILSAVALDLGDRNRLASAVAESALLVGRIEFFDLRKADVAAETFARALQIAGEGDDSLLGSAILAHAAFVPGWAGDRSGASDRLAAARAYARRAGASPLMLAWLDAVDAECATLSGDLKDALGLLDHADALVQNGSSEPLPEWMDWFTPTRLAAFKGNTQLKAGQLRRARATLTAVLDELPEADSKQRAVILADLAAVNVAAEEVEDACRHLNEALDQLGLTWYSAAMERVRDVRRLLHPWRDRPSVRDLDDRIYSWDATLTAVRT